MHRVAIDDRLLNVSQIANIVGISRERVEDIKLNELGMLEYFRKMAAAFDA